MSTTTYPDAMQAAPHMHEVLLENDRVRVLGYRCNPGDRAELHSHPDNVVCHVEGAFRARATDQDGNSREFDVEPGVCLWSDAAAHVFESVGGEPARGLIIELK